METQSESRACGSIIHGGQGPHHEMEKRCPKIHERGQEMGRDMRELTRLGCGRIRAGAWLSPLHTPGQRHWVIKGRGPARKREVPLGEKGTLPQGEPSPLLPWEGRLSTATAGDTRQAREASEEAI